MINNYAKIQSGKVVNIQLVKDSDFFDPNYLWIVIDNVLCTDDSPVQKDCTYDGHNFVSALTTPQVKKFDSKLCIKMLYETFNNQTVFFDLAPYWALLQTLIEWQNWQSIHQLALELISQNLINQELFEEVNSIFMQQDVDLRIY